MAADIFKGFPALQQLAAVAKEAGVTVEPIPHGRSKRVHAKRALVDGNCFKVASPSRVEAGVAKKFGKGGRGYVQAPYLVSTRGYAALAFPLQVKRGEKVITKTFCVPLKKYKKLFPEGRARMPVEPNRNEEAGRPPRIDWDLYEGAKGLLRCLKELRQKR